MLKSARPTVPGAPPKYGSSPNAKAQVAPTGMSHALGRRFRLGMAVGNSHKKNVPEISISSGFVVVGVVGWTTSQMRRSFADDRNPPPVSVSAEKGRNRCPDETH